MLIMYQAELDQAAVLNYNVTHKAAISSSRFYCLRSLLHLRFLFGTKKVGFPSFDVRFRSTNLCGPPGCWLCTTIGAHATVWKTPSGWVKTKHWDPVRCFRDICGPLFHRRDRLHKDKVSVEFSGSNSLFSPWLHMFESLPAPLIFYPITFDSARVRTPQLACPHKSHLVVQAVCQISVSGAGYRWLNTHTNAWFPTATFTNYKPLSFCVAETHFCVFSPSVP